MVKVLLCCLWAVLSGFCSSLSASIIKFEFVEEPNEGEHEIKDNNDHFGSKDLGSFKITIAETPADFLLMDQHLSIPRLTADIPDDLEEGINIDSIELYEGITYLYLFGRNPQGSVPWVVGPRTFDDGRQLYFIVDQGPPKAPEVGHFFVDGNRVRTSDTSFLSDCATNFTTVFAFYMTCQSDNSHVMAEIVFNSFDNRFTESLALSFIGTVTNDTSIFDPDPNEEPNPDPAPGATDRKESNARISAQLDRILGILPTDGPPLTVEFVSDVLSRTGPFALDMSKIDLSNVAQPNTDDARSGDFGEFTRIGFDVKNLADGNYEIIVGARDAANNFSPGGFVNFGNAENPADGIPTRILIIKDTISPQKISLYKPSSVFIFGNTPPSVDPPYEDSFWTLSGNVYDERKELVRVHVFAQDSPDHDGSNETANNQDPDQIFTTNPQTGNFQALIDSTNWVPVYPALDQVAYRWVMVPEDLHGNVNVLQITELFMIKDTKPPPTPYFIDLKDGDSISSPIATIHGRADNNVASALAEHGTANFILEIFHETALGSIGLTTYTLPGASSSEPVTNSVLDSSFVATTIIIPIIDPRGVATGQVETVELPDRTEIFNNLIFTDFTFAQNVNFTNMPDGILRFDLCLLDQVGNKSDPCSSVTIYKDLTGPIITFQLQNSGPDDNYKPNFFPDLPNFHGADDNEFRISLKSPERTLDPMPNPPSALQIDPHFVLPGVPEPHNIALLLHGLSQDSFSDTTSIEVWGSRIQRFTLLNDAEAPSGVDVEYSYDGSSFTVNQQSFVASTDTFFELHLPLFDLLDGVNEVVNLRALDSLGNWGPTTQISIIRDVTPPAPPTILVPPKIVGSSVPIHYTNTDTMNIHGRTEVGARVVIFLPPEGAEAGYPMTETARIKRTAPDAIPLAGSDYDTIAEACGELKCLFPEVKDDGSFYVSGMDISTIAHSLQTATTIYIQAIDSFDNTDPVSSVVAIEIHKNNLNVPVEYLYILNYPEKGAENQVLIYPDSLGESPGLTVFYSFDMVDLRIATQFPMLKAPDLQLRQAGYLFTDTGKKSSNFPSQLGTFIFDYTYEVRPQVMEYDGIVDFSISGGVDMFGNPVQVTTGTNVFIVDTVAPNRYSSPTIVLSPLDSLLITTFVSARIDFTDFFKDTDDTEFASGVETSALKISLYGPLHESPDSLNEVALTTFLPLEENFDFAARLAQPLSTDGIYRLEYVGVDRVGNYRRFDRNFVLDREAIVPPLLVTLPEHGAVVNTMPFDFVTNKFFNRMTVQDIEANFTKSSFEVYGPQAFLATDKEVRLAESSVYGMFTPSSLPWTDGSSDGFYEIHMSVFDKADNQTTKIHRYLLDTQPMLVTTFYPTLGQCVSQLDLVQFAVREDESFSAVVAGLDRTKSKISLLLEEPYPITNFSAVGRQTQTTIVYSSMPDLANSTADIIMSRIIESGTGFPLDGSFDGVYRIEGEFSDLASNAAAASSTFALDSIRPTIDLSGFGDGEYVTRRNFRFTGTVADRGLCGLEAISPTNYRTDILQLMIYNWDIDAKEKGELLAGPIYPDFIEINDPFSHPVESAQGSFIISGIISGVRVAAFEWTLTDRAGNQETVRRIVHVSDMPPAYPIRIEPLQKIDFRGQQLSYYTSNPVQFLRWTAVPEAKHYDLHLNRLSLGTIGPVTTLRLPANTTSLSVDYALINTAVVVPIAENEVFSWRVDTIDGIGQSSNFYGDADMVNPPELLSFDRLSPVADEDMVFILADGIEYNLKSFSTFATAPDFTLRFRSPEPLRINNSQESAWLDFYRHTTCPPDFSTTNYSYRLNYEAIATLPVETDIFDFSFAMPEADINGCGVFQLAGFRDRAGNRLNDFSAYVKVDRGPKFEVKLFQNPVDPLSFTFVFKGLDYDGRNDLLLYSPNSTPPSPIASFRQTGFAEFVNLELVPIRLVTAQNQQYATAYTGSFTVNMKLLGDVILRLQAIDLFGHTAQEDVYLQVDTTRRLLRSANRLIFASPSVDEADQENYLYGYRHHADLNSPLSAVDGREIFDLPNFPWIYYPRHSQDSLSTQGSYTTSNCQKLVFVQIADDGTLELPEQQNTCTEGSFNYEVRSKRFNSLQLIRDSAIPELDFPNSEQELESGWHTIEVYSQDQQSGVSAVSLLLDQQEYPLEPQAAGLFSRRVFLEPGLHNLQFSAKDWAGNTSILRSDLSVLRPFGLDRLAIYPNPVRREAFLECVFARRPDNCRWRLFDSAGRQISIVSPPCDANIKERLPMEDSRGRSLANGVYFLRLQAEYQGQKIEKTLKFAILR